MIGGRSYLSRGLHSVVPVETIKRAIRSCIQLDTEANIESVRLGNDPLLDTRLIVAASQAASIPVPDHVLSTLKTVGDLLKYLCTPNLPPRVKGIPKFELFAGENLPRNVTLINYRKKRWSDSTYAAFLKSSMKEVGLLGTFDQACINLDKE
jgi:acyl carrier protein